MACRDFSILEWKNLSSGVQKDLPTRNMGMRGILPSCMSSKISENSSNVPNPPGKKTKTLELKVSMTLRAKK